MDISPNYAGTINGVATGLGFAPAVLTSEMLGNIIKGNVSTTMYIPKHTYVQLV